MSNAIRGKKRKMCPKNYDLKPVVLNQVKEQAMLSRCFSKVFTSLQLCSWYVLYAPEYFDWNYEQCKGFSDKMHGHNIEYGMAGDEYPIIRDKLSGDIGVDIVSEAKKFPYRVKINMYGGKVNQKNVTNIVFAMNLAIESVLFLGLYTLYHDFSIAPEDIREVFIPHLMEIAWNYANGMTDKHMIKYFNGLEGWQIFDADGEEMLA